LLCSQWLLRYPAAPPTSFCAAAQQRSTTTTALVFYDAQHCSCRADYYDSNYCLLIQSTSLARPECKARDGGEVIVTYSASAQGYASALWWNRSKHARQSSAWLRSREGLLRRRRGTAGVATTQRAANTYSRLRPFGVGVVVARHSKRCVSSVKYSPQRTKLNKPGFAWRSTVALLLLKRDQEPLLGTCCLVDRAEGASILYTLSRLICFKVIGEALR
jgi:hypothetical protein